MKEKCAKDICMNDTCKQDNYMKQHGMVNNVNNNCRVTGKKQLEEAIMQASFAIDDIKLYLDTHPCDGDALKMYEDYRKIRKVALKEYTQNYGPMSAYDVNVDNYWSWVNSPWPWEGVC
jgi:spore coat protein JB